MNSLRKSVKYLPLIAILLFNSCKKVENLDKSTFFFTFNKWGHWKDASPPMGFYNIFYSSVSPAHTLSITVTKFHYVNGPAQILTFWMDDVAPGSLAEYKLGYDNVAIFVPWIADYRSHFIEGYYTNDSCGGILKITKFDQSAKKISGTFHFEAPYDHRGVIGFDYNDKLVVTNGHFDDADYQEQ